MRANFDSIAWVTLGQTPDLDQLIDILHLQITGTKCAVTDPEEKKETLRSAFGRLKVLLVLDDAWASAEVDYLDQTADNGSRVLLTSRIREALESSEVCSLPLPTRSGRSTRSGL